MDVVVQISDPHFGTERPDVVEALVAFVHTQAPTLLVLSGDLTQRARTAQFDAAAAFVRRLGVPAVLAIPGNHDIPLYDLPGRLLRPYAGWRRAFGEELEPVHESDHLLAIAVKTTRRLRHVDGEVSEAQIERVARRLERAHPNQLRLVVTHQPAFTVREEDAPDRLHNAEPALRRWAAAGADIVLGGHIHLPYVVALHERLDGLARRMWAVQAGTAVSSRVRHEAGNSVNVLRWPWGPGPRRCTVERWDCESAVRGFERATQQRLELSAPPPA
ncbi:MAG: metallophosphoesterase [Burkholderiales bacterium]|nr:MAG: metallophosphoesterase [Burkholderiales bacterium]